MNKNLEFDSGLFGDSRQFGKTQLTCEVDSADTLILPELDAEGVSRIGLGAEVDGYLGCMFLGENQHSRIRNYQGIDSDFLKIFKIGRNFPQFMFPCKYIYGDIDFLSVVVGKKDCRGKFLRVEIMSKSTEPEIFFRPRKRHRPHRERQFCIFPDCRPVQGVQVFGLKFWMRLDSWFKIHLCNGKFLLVCFVL